MIADGYADVVLGTSHEGTGFLLNGASRTHVFRSAEEELPTNIERPIARTFSLDGRAPNPFAEQATIRYTLSGPADVNMSAFDLLGRRVDVQVDRRQREGQHHVTFRAGDHSPGVYLYRLQAGADAVTGRMVLAE